MRCWTFRDKNPQQTGHHLEPCGKPSLLKHTSCNDYLHPSAPHCPFKVCGTMTSSPISYLNSSGSTVW
jgi:hypothetical protein